MPNLLTPARLTTIAGVATGLAAAATSLAGVFTTGSSVGNAIVAAAGVLGTVATVAKFLDGNAKWETTLLTHQAVRGANLPALPGGDPVCAPGDGFVFDSPPEPDASTSVVLPGEEPIPDSPEPERLVEQYQTYEAELAAEPQA